MVGVFTSVGRSYMDNITFRGRCMRNKTLKLATTHQTLYNMTNCHIFKYCCCFGACLEYYFTFGQRLPFLVSIKIVTAPRAYTSCFGMVMIRLCGANRLEIFLDDFQHYFKVFISEVISPLLEYICLS